MQSAMSGAKRPMSSRNCRPMASRCSSQVVAGELVGRVLPEHAHEVPALGRGGGVVPGLEVHLAVADVGDAGPAVLEGPLRALEALRHRDHRAERPRLAGRRRERGQPGERGVELHDRAADLPGLQPLLVRRRHGTRALEHAERALRVGVAHHRAGPEQLATGETHAFTGKDLGHLDPAGECRAGLGRGFGEGEADHAHAAPHVAPHRALPLEVALVVHQLHGRRAPVTGAGVGADHALTEERVLDALVADVVVEHVRDRRLEEDVDHPLVVAEHGLELVAGGRVPDPAVPAPGAQQLAHVVEDLLVRPVAVDVGGGEAERLQPRLRAGVVVPLGQRRAVLEGCPQVGIGHEHLEPAAAQVELVDDHGIEQADDVRAGAHDVAVVREGAFEGACAPQPLAALQHQDRPAGAGQIGRAGQSVVSASDHHRVPLAGGQLRHRGREADFAEGVCDRSP